MWFLTTFITAFVASATAFNLLPPENGWAKTGSTKELICESSVPIESCSWDTPYGKHYPLSEGLTAESGRLAYASNNDKECGIKISNVKAKDDGVWVCNVGTVDNGEITTGKGQSRLNIAQKPRSVLLMDPYNTEFINVTAETVQIQCVVEDAMPEPTFVWSIDDELLENADTKTDRDGQTWIQTLTYQPEATHHNRSLVCKTNHIGFEKGDETEASTIIVFASNDRFAEPSADHDKFRQGPYWTMLIVIGVGIGIIAICAVPCVVNMMWRKYRDGEPFCAKSGNNHQSLDQEMDEKKAAAANDEVDDDASKGDNATVGTSATDEEDKEKPDGEGETEVTNEETKDQDQSAVVTTFGQKLASFFKWKNGADAKKVDSEDVEAAAIDVKGEEEDKQVNEQTEADTKEDAAEEEPKKSNRGRFSVWKLIRWPRAATAVAKKTEVDVEGVKTDDSVEKEKAACEEEGEKKMVELEPEDKPEPQSDDKPEPQSDDKPEPQFDDKPKAQSDDKPKHEPEDKLEPQEEQKSEEVRSTPTTL